MVRFAESSYNASQRRYEQSCREANAGDPVARASSRDGIVSNLVKGGLPAIEEYEALMDKRWKAAKCLAQYDGVSMGYANAREARAELGLPLNPA